MNHTCPGSIPEHVMEKTRKHPCYSSDAHRQYARMHLPVAPNCNIQCNYCNRKFDCVNESRPGVTSEVLSPLVAKEKFDWVKKEIPQLRVVGIAGPGDALADWDYTKETIEKIKAADPEVTYCLSTNGLLMLDYADEIISLGIHHVTVTVNAIDPEIGAQIYKYVSYRRKRYAGIEAARVLIQNQLAGIAYLAAHGVLVKVNIVMITGINDRHIPVVVQTVKDLGAFITNIMPLIPAPGSIFAHYPQTSMKEVHAMRELCQLELQQMHHCQQCRADAVGLLHEDRSQEFRLCTSREETVVPYAAAQKSLYKIAVTSKYGKLVDQHFGHAAEFIIYQGNGQEFSVVERRAVNKFCAGMEECGEEAGERDSTINALQDCQAVLTMRIGQHATDKLAELGIRSIEYCDTVENGLRHTVNVLLEEAAQAVKGVKAG